MLKVYPNVLSAACLHIYVLGVMCSCNCITAMDGFDKNANMDLVFS